MGVLTEITPNEMVKLVLKCFKSLDAFKALFIFGIFCLIRCASLTNKITRLRAAYYFGVTLD